MGFAGYYLEKYSCTGRLIKDPAENPDIIVVLPCYREPQLIRSLDSIKNCDLTGVKAEVIVVINSRIHERDEALALNRISFNEASGWAEKHSTPGLRFFILNIQDIPAKHAGVGMARKTGMDEAVRRFQDCGNQMGIITGFDADSICDSNYFTELTGLFRQYPEATGCSIYFEHPLSGTDYSEANYNAIVLYELYLRYFTGALRYAGFPYAFHTLGSSFAVSVDA